MYTLAGLSDYRVMASQGRVMAGRSTQILPGKKCRVLLFLEMHQF